MQIRSAVVLCSIEVSFKKGSTVQCVLLCIFHACMYVTSAYRYSH